MRISKESRPELRAVPGQISWTFEQKNVIESGVQDRILVDAGPGTGKTATACARISWLINSGVIEPSEIWLISFTRTAVHELRTRISSYLKEPSSVAALRIATIDTHAWAIHSGFDEMASISGSFDDNIQRVINLVKNHEGVFDYLSSVRHLVVDEAQDVVGLRCELLLEIINVLPHTSGVSIFSDEAQSIYGFADDGLRNTVEGNLPESIKQYMPYFREMDLSQVHRTADNKLLKVFAEGRKLVREKRSNGASCLSEVKELVGTTNHGVLGLYRDDIKALPKDLTDAFLLFRRRGEVLDASSYLDQRHHRLRMSGLPVSIYGWVAVLFWDWTKPEMERADFETLWDQRIGTPSSSGAASAWSNLVAAFGQSASRISITRMVTRLASASPPFELTTPEFGSYGPIIGTIHGSKGREAHEVRIYIPSSSSEGKNENEQLNEEARILFVGATRAKDRLCVGKSASKAIPRRLQHSGRAYTPYPFSKGKRLARAAVEVGRIGDIDADGLVGKAFYCNQLDALSAQRQVIDLKTNMGNAYATSMDRSMDWRYQISVSESDKHLCYLGKNINTDFFSIAKIINEIVHQNKLNPPSKFNYLRTFGFRTLALSPSDEIRERLHPPWCHSGIMAAPMLIGYPIVYFR